MNAQRASTLVVAALAAALPGCAFWPDNTPPDSATATQFIALPSAFQGYRGWPQFEVPAGTGGDGHVRAARTVYASVAIDDDSSFAVGSIVLKTGLGADGGPQMHGMVKRGGGFNADGARGWEWFEFSVRGDGALIQDWRGADPPDGECYGLLPGQPCEASLSSCSACHADAQANDYVYSPQLTLGSIDAALLR